MDAERGCPQASASSHVSGATLRLSPRHLLTLTELAAALLAIVSAASTASRGLIATRVSERSVSQNVLPLWLRVARSELSATFERPSLRWTQLVPMRGSDGGEGQNSPGVPLALYHFSSTARTDTFSLSHRLGASSAVQAVIGGTAWTPAWMPLRAHGHPAAADAAAAAAVGSFQNLPGGSQASGSRTRMLATFAEFVPAVASVAALPQHRRRDISGLGSSSDTYEMTSWGGPPAAVGQVSACTPALSEQTSCTQPLHKAASASYRESGRSEDRVPLSSSKEEAQRGAFDERRAPDKGAIFLGAVSVVAEGLPGKHSGGHQRTSKVSPHAHPFLAAPLQPKPRLRTCFSVCFCLDVAMSNPCARQLRRCLESFDSSSSHDMSDELDRGLERISPIMR
jgi:hypothetical protein